MSPEHLMQGQERAELDAWKDVSIEELIRHILEKYHWETRHGMAELESLAEAAAAQEGHNFPVLLAIRDEVDLFCTEMRGHLKDEEVTLFPAILARVQGREVQIQEELLDPLELFQDEHDAAAGLLVRIQRTPSPSSASSTPPARIWPRAWCAISTWKTRSCSAGSWTRPRRPAHQVTG
jgi:iron-sulfur cluster repair protein YtfE (RIC family)